MAAYVRPYDGLTVKTRRVVAVPVGVVRLIGPVVAASGTMATTLLSVTKTMVAGVPLKDTLLALRKLWPEMLTWVPAVPDAGVNTDTTGVTAVVTRSIGQGGDVGEPEGAVRSARDTVRA